MLRQMRYAGCPNRRGLGLRDAFPRVTDAAVAWLEEEALTFFGCSAIEGLSIRIPPEN